MKSGMLFYICVFFVLMAVVYLLFYFWMYQFFGGVNVMEKIFCLKLMGKFFYMLLLFFEKYRMGDLMVWGINDLQVVSMMMGFGVLMFVDLMMYMLMIFLMMGFVISWKLIFVVIILLLIMVAVVSLYGKKIYEWFIEVQDVFGLLNDKVLELVFGVWVIWVFVQEKNDVS